MRRPWRPRKFSVAFRGRLFVIKTFKGPPFNILTQHAFYAPDLLLIFFTDKSEGVSRLQSAACPPDAVRVRIRRVRHIVVDDMRNTQNINTSGRYIGCYKDLVRTVAEPVKGFLALVLREISLEGRGSIPCLLQLLRDPFCTVFCLRKDQYRFGIGLL